MKLGRVTLASILFLAGCRSLIGVTVLEVEETDSGVRSPDASTGLDGQSDALSTFDVASLFDANDAGPPPPVDGGGFDAATCGLDPQSCPPCCHQNLGAQLGKFQSYAITAGCVCGAGACGATSDAGCEAFCPGGGGGLLPGSCNMCLDMALVSNSAECITARNQCSGDPDCQPAVACYQACFP